MSIPEQLAAALADRYRLVEEIGAGGMATVYLAEDLKHHRRVALKVLRPELAAVVGAERFLAEIETTANLNHPHILPLHDSGEAEGSLFYVMPYVEGESLRDRLDREHQLPVEEAVRIAGDLAEALDYAHRHGVIHRDIKPANILMHEGRPVIADFGIALAVGAGGGTRLTETGLSLGTPYYMSPEQATGDADVGPASDTYALACVLYEMLVGEPPYVGTTAQAVLGKIISGGAVYAREQRGSVPANVDAAIRKALEKLPADRYSSAQGFAEALADPAFRYGERQTGAGTWNRVSIGASVLAGVFAVAFGWAVTRPEPSEPTTRVWAQFPENQALVGSFDLSSDGDLLVYSGTGSGGTSRALWVRRWATLEAMQIPGTNGIGAPVVSPDGREVAFFNVNNIRILPLEGGISRDIGSDTLSSGVFRWAPDGEWIYYLGYGTSSIFRVPAEGGPEELVVTFDSVSASNQWFDILPSGDKGVTQLTFDGAPNLYSVDLRTGKTGALTAGRFPRYANGHLFFATPDGGSLMRAPFDPKRMVLTGPAVTVAEEVYFDGTTGRCYYTVSRTGTLVYLAGRAPLSVTDVVWVDREGEITAIDPDWTFDPGANNRGLSLSPDGTRLAVTVFDDGNYDIYVKELPQGPLSRLTTHPAWDVRPRWAPDGQAITFISDRNAAGNNANILSMRASGTGDPVLLMDHQLPLWEAVHSREMDWLLGRTGGSATVAGGRDVWATQVGTDSVFPLLQSDSDEKAISLSPDDRFLLYESDRTGQNEVYVSPFPNVDDDRITVSAGGGVMPVWSRAGDEIFYVDAENRMVAARVETDPRFRVVDRRVLLQLPEDILFRQNEQYPLYDVSPDGQRFVMFRVHTSGEQRNELILVTNWLGELEGGS